MDNFQNKNHDLKPQNSKHDVEVQVGRVRGRDGKGNVIQAMLSALRLRVTRNIGRRAGGRARVVQHAGRLRERGCEFGQCNEFAVLVPGRSPDDDAKDTNGCTCNCELVLALNGMDASLVAIGGRAELAGIETCKDEFGENDLL